uniref:Putative secreted protein n=1 Tax=Anopheles darlingi TaxID=43151 RepID=A0A2M4D5S6_ANODA
MISSLSKKLPRKYTCILIVISPGALSSASSAQQASTKSSWLRRSTLTVSMNSSNRGSRLSRFVTKCTSGRS